MTDQTKIHTGDIVAFNNSATHTAAVFCRKRGICGKVIREESGLFAIDAGFDYEIFAKHDQLVVIAARNEIPYPIDVEN